MLNTLDPYTEFEGEQLAQVTVTVHSPVRGRTYRIAVPLFSPQTHTYTLLSRHQDMREAVSGRYGGVGLVIAGSKAPGER